jgi:hypothetical protein
MKTTMEHLKIAGLNLASWGGTYLSASVVREGLAIAVPICSVAVSLASLWWIRRQAQSLDRKDKSLD